MRCPPPTVRRIVGGAPCDPSGFGSWSPGLGLLVACSDTDRSSFLVSCIRPTVGWGQVHVHQHLPLAAGTHVSRETSAGASPQIAQFVGALRARARLRRLRDTGPAPRRRYGKMESAIGVRNRQGGFTTNPAQAPWSRVVKIQVHPLAAASRCTCSVQTGCRHRMVRRLSPGRPSMRRTRSVDVLPEPDVSRETARKGDPPSPSYCP